MQPSALTSLVRFMREFNHAVDRSAEDFLRDAIDFDLTNAANEGTGAGGGYTVPAPVSTQMIRVLETVGVAPEFVISSP